MQQAIPYSNGKTWMPLPSPTALGSMRNGLSRGSLARLVTENPVLVVGKMGCCMCHVVRRLLLGLGVNPVVAEIDDEGDTMEELRMMMSEETGTQLPAVFIGGRHVGGLDQLMAAHISGDLVPILKQAGALWL